MITPHRNVNGSVMAVRCTVQPQQESNGTLVLKHNHRLYSPPCDLDQRFFRFKDKDTDPFLTITLIKGSKRSILVCTASIYAIPAWIGNSQRRIRPIRVSATKIDTKGSLGAPLSPVFIQRQGTWSRETVGMTLKEPRSISNINLRLEGLRGEVTGQRYKVIGVPSGRRFIWNSWMLNCCIIILGNASWNSIHPRLNIALYVERRAPGAGHW